MDWLGPLISGASSLLGGVIGAKTTHDENRFWADYNNPKNTMKRLSDAGLNPNLIYRNGAALTPATPVGDPGAQVQQGISQASSKFAEMLQAKANVKNVESNTVKNQSETALNAAKTQQVQALTDIYKSDAYQQQFSSQNAERQARIDLFATQADKTQAEKTCVDIQKKQMDIAYEIDSHFGFDNALRDNLMKRYDEQMRKSYSEVYDDILELEVQLKRAGISLNEAQMSKLYSDIVLNNALRDTQVAQQGLIHQQEANEHGKAVGQSLQNGLLKMRGYEQAVVNHWLGLGIDIRRYSTSRGYGLFHMYNGNSSDQGNWQDLQYGRSTEQRFNDMFSNH